LKKVGKIDVLMLTFRENVCYFLDMTKKAKIMRNFGNFFVGLD